MSEIISEIIRMLPGTRVSLLELLSFATDMQLFFFAKLLLILLYHKS